MLGRHVCPERILDGSGISRVRVRDLIKNLIFLKIYQFTNMGVLGGNYKEYPIYFVFMILLALIAVGYFDNNFIVIVLSIVALISVYIYLPRRARTTS